MVLKRLVRRVTIGVLLSGVVGVLVWYAARHEIAGWLIDRAVGDVIADYRIEDVAPGHVMMASIRLSPSGTIDRAELAWSLAGLLAGRFDGLRMSGVDAVWPDVPGAVFLPAGLPATITVEDIRLTVPGPWGMIDIGADATLLHHSNDLFGSGTWHTSMPGLLAGGTFSLSREGRGGTMRLDVTPDRIEPDLPGVTMGPVSGHVVVEQDGRIEANLVWPSVTVAGVMIGDLALETFLDDEGFRGNLTTTDVGITFRQDNRIDSTGDMLIETAGVQLARWLATDEMEARVTFTMEGGSFRARLAQPATLDAWFWKLPQAVRFEVSAEDAWLNVRRLDDGWDVAAGLEARCGIPERSRGNCALEGVVRLDHSGVPLSFSIPRIELAAAGDLVDGHASGTVRIVGNLGGAPGNWQGSVGLESLFEEVKTDGMHAYNATLDMPAAITFDRDGLAITTETSALIHIGEFQAGSAIMAGVVAELPLRISELERGIEVRLTDTGWIDVQTVEHDLVRTLGPASIELEREQLPLFVLEMLGRDLSWDLRLKISETPVYAVVMPDGSAPVLVEGIGPDLGIRLESLGTRYLQATMEAHGGDLRLSGPDLVIGDVRALMNYNNGLSVWPQISTDIRRIEDLRAPQRFGPLSIDVVTSPVWPAGDDARISVTIHSDHARFLGAIDAVYTPLADRLEAFIRTNSVVFEKPGLQPADLSPAYGSIFRDAQGMVNLQGRVWLEKGDVGADLALTIEDVSAEVSGIPFRHLDGRVTVIDVLPLVTQPAQTFILGYLETPVPLSDIEMALSLPGDGTVVVERAAAKLPSGRSFTMESMGGDSREMVFHLTGLDADSLLDHAGVDDIRMESTLEGEIHVSIDDSGVTFSRALLRSGAPGTLAWNGGGSLEFDVLAVDFDRMASLRVTIVHHGCRTVGVFPFEGNIGVLAGKVRVWLGDAGCDRT